MLIKIIIVAVILLMVFLVIVALQPANYRVQRMAGIPAPAGVVFTRVNDFHNWKAWSPWAKLDPDAKNGFEGSPSGAGAIFTWSGNKKIGEGRMCITESRPGELIRLDLEFIRPFPNKCVTEFAFKPEGSQTTVTWTMTGKNNFMGKAFCMFMNMDKMVGGDFERGLTNLKSVSETAAKS